jgi:hypothetical protein
VEWGQCPAAEPAEGRNEIPTDGHPAEAILMEGGAQEGGRDAKIAEGGDSHGWASSRGNIDGGRRPGGREGAKIAG